MTTSGLFRAMCALAARLALCAACGTLTVAAQADTTPPTAPKLVSATSGNAGIAVRWTAASDNVRVTKYKVWRGDASYGKWVLLQQLPASALAYTDASVNAGQTYTYSIRAVDAAGNISTGSNAIRVTAMTTGGVSISDVPTLFDATDGSVDYLHTPIAAGAIIDPGSAAILAAANLARNVPRVAGPDWLVPIYRTSDGDPAYNPLLAHASDWGCSVGGGIHIPDEATRELPGMQQGGDAWIAVVNSDDATVKAIWQADKSSGVWEGSCAGSFALHGNGFTRLAGIGNGAGAQIGAGIILFKELAQGRIDHALYLTSTVSCRRFRPPALKSDGQSTAATCVPMGARVQLDPAVDCSALPAGATAAERMICHALQTYGGYILDSGGSGPVSGVSIQGDDPTDPARASWRTPGNGERGTRNCTPVSASCGQAAHLGILGRPDDLAHIPWQSLRMLAHWDGS